MKTLKRWLMIASIFSYSLPCFTKTVIISDIDDTIKKANSMGAVGGAWHFLLKKPYKELRDLFNEMKKFENAEGEEVGYYYVSAAPSYIFNANEWIKSNEFPSGEITLKTLGNGGGTYDYKYRTIKAILNKELANDPVLKVIFFGDNSAYDALVYSNLKKEMNLLNPLIYIRDVSTEATYFDSNLPVRKIEGVDYFFSERELLDNSYFHFMSDHLKDLIKKQYKKKMLIPGYTFSTLVDRLKSICKEETARQMETCRQEAQREANQYWQDYHQRF